jgi:hypothetical protein
MLQIITKGLAAAHPSAKIHLRCRPNEMIGDVLKEINQKQDIQKKQTQYDPQCTASMKYPHQTNNIKHKPDEIPTPLHSLAL